MRVCVLKEGNPLPSKHNDGMNQRVTFENIDTGSPKYVYLNMTDDIRNKWIHVISAGNVLDVQVREGTNQINKYGQYNVIKLVTKGEVTR